jgi:hypothetical protein
MSYYYLPTIYQSYLIPNYLYFIFLSTYLVSTYIFTYLANYGPTNLLMKKIEIQMLLYTLKKNYGNSKIHVKSIWYHIVLQSDGVVWWPRHWCGTKETKV